jgi:hypothetical protein
MSDLGKYILKADGNVEHKYGDYLLHQITTGTTPIELTSDGMTASTTPSTTNRLVVPVGTTFFSLARIAARQDTGADNASFMRYFIIENTASTTSLVGSVTTLGTDLGSNGGAPPTGWAVSVTADDTNDSIKIDVTGVSLTNIHWLAKVETVEVKP